MKLIPRPTKKNSFLAFLSLAVLLASAALSPMHAEEYAKPEPLPEEAPTDPMMGRIMALRRPKYTANGELGRDNKHRSDQILNHSLELLHTGNLTWRVLHRISQFSEDEFPTVRENAGGLGINQQFGLYHNLDLYGMGHSFNHDLRTTYSAGGNFTSHWTDNFQTQIRGERIPVYTARALNNETTQNRGGLKLEFKFFDLWKVRMDGQHAAVSDENRRNSGIFEVARYVERRYGVSVLYRLTMDHMRNISPNYYSPQHLTQHQVGFDLPVRWETDFIFHLTYLPGIGKESNSATHVVHTLSAELRKTWAKRFTLGVAGAGATTPTYRSARGRLTLEYRF